jgi:DNA-binding NarL/FixJ family response regulator
MSEDRFGGHISGPSLLICDDNPGIRALLSALVSQSAGIQVVSECADGAEALIEAERLQPDVILLDLAMPGSDGFATLPKLRRVAPNARIIVFSGFASDKVASQVIKLGATSYLEKGASSDLIIATIYEALSSPWLAEPTPGTPRLIPSTISANGSAPREHL